MSTTKEDLELLLAVSFDDPISIDAAYKAYSNYMDLISDADNDTIDYLWRLVKYDRQALLKVRMNFAEKGFELTPNQCEQYIFVLATSLVDSIHEDKPKA